VARTGFFSGPSTPYGQPISVVQPTDNVFQPAGSSTTSGTGGTVTGGSTTASAELQAQITVFYDFLRHARGAATAP